jgi:hypothetical protein
MNDDVLDQEQLEFFAQTEGLSIDDMCSDFSMLRFVDVESSGLNKGSYPIEYGSCGLDLAPSSFLIRRKCEFGLTDWSIVSQSIHNITVDDLDNFGIDSKDAVSWIKRDLAPGVVGLSDNAENDAAWLSRLSPDLEALDIYPVGLFLRQARLKALERQGYERLSQATMKVQARYPHIHRAGPDSLRMAALFKVLVDDEFVDSILKS